MTEQNKNLLVDDASITLEMSYAEQMARARDSHVTGLMHEAFAGTPEGDELGLPQPEIELPEMPGQSVVQAGMVPDPEGISKWQALGQIMLGGPTDALKNFATNVTQAGDDFRQWQIEDRTVQEYLDEGDRFLGTENFFGDVGGGGLLGGRVDIPVGTLERKGGGGVQFLRGLSGFATAMMFLRGMGATTFGAGVGADAFFLENEQNLSNMFNEFVPEDSPFRNPITDYLAAKTDDSEFTKAMKIAAEGTGITLPISMLAGVTKLVKRWRDAKQARRKPSSGDPVSAGPESGMRTRVSFDDQDFDLSGMKLPFETINNEKIIKKISAELEAIAKRNTDAAGDLRTGKKGREIEFQAGVEKEARKKFFANPEGETKRLLELDPGKELNRVEQLEFGLVQHASLQRVDDLVRAGDETSATLAMEQFRFHIDVIEEQFERFSETAGRELGIRKRLKKGDLGEGRKLQSVAERVKLKVDPNIDPMTFARKWQETAPEEWVKETRRLGGWDMIFEGWINSLFGMKTHVVNTLGNIANISLQVGERGVAGQIRKMKRAFGASGSGVEEGEAMDMLYGMLTSQGDNLAVLAKNLGRIGTFKEIPASQFQKLEQANVRAITGANAGLKEGSGMYKAVDIVGHIMTSQGKLLLTVDEYFKMNAYMAAIRAQARRVAMSEGKEDEQLARRIAQLIKEPSPAIKANAQNFADYATFTKELGVPGKKMHEFIANTPLGRYVVPFHNVLVNIAKFTGERTPMALFSKKVRADIMAGGARADLAQARIATGTAASMAFLTMALGDGLTGGGPQNKKMREALKRKGWQPYSVVVTGKDGKTRYVSYQRAEPVAFFAGLMADYVEIADQISEGERIGFAKGFVLTLSQHFLSQTFAQSVGDLLNGWRRGDSRFFENLGSSFIPFGGVFRDIEKTVDPTLRDTKTVDPNFLRLTFREQFGKEQGDAMADSAEVLYRTLQKIKANLPGYSDELSPRRNMWGDVVAYERGVGWDPMSPFFIQTEKDSPVDDWILELKIPVGLPEPMIASGDPGNPVRLTHEQHNNYIVLAGIPAFKHLDAKVRTKEFINKPDGYKSKYIEGIIRMERVRAAKRLLELVDKDGNPKYPDLHVLLNPQMLKARAQLIANKLKKITTQPGQN